MSSRSLCRHEGCENRSFADQDRCLHHLPNALELQQEYTALIIRETLLQDLNLPAITLDGIDFSHKTLMNCDFHAATLRNCTFNECNMTFCLFDHSTFQNAKIHESKFLESIFASSRFNDIEFTVSDIIQCNFNGSSFTKTRFMAGDLMYSRFLAIMSDDLQFEDCNLKGVWFSEADSTLQSFKYSNKEDAFFI